MEGVINFLNQYQSVITAIDVLIIPVVIVFITYWTNKNTLKLQNSFDEEKSRIDKFFEKQNLILQGRLDSINTESSVVLDRRIGFIDSMNENMHKMFSLIRALDSYGSYSCKPNVDFNSTCPSNSCKDDCILNYWNKFKNLNKIFEDTVIVINKSEVYFPIEIVHAELIILTSIKDLIDSITQLLDKGFSGNELAYEVFEICSKFDYMAFSNSLHSLQNQYRNLLGVSLSSTLSDFEYRKLRDKF